MDFKDYLDTTVLQEKKPVTYRSLARKLNIHVNIAKQVLYHYSTVEPSVVPVFCLTGTLADNSFSIRLVNQDDLDETKKLYRQLSGVHVYSLLPCRPKDFSVLVAANKDMVAVSVEDRIKNGLIYNSSVKTNNQGNAEVSSLPPPSDSKAHITSTPSPTKNTTEKSIFGSASTTKSTAMATAKSKMTSSTTPTKRKGTLSFEKATPRAKKQELEKPKSPPPSTPCRKIKIIQESDEEESEDEEALDERLARSAKIQVNDIFSDDEEEQNPDVETNSKDDDDDDDDDGGARSTTTRPSSMDIDTDDDNIAEDVSTKMDQDENNEQDQQITPGKIRRKVQKKKTYRNERGFLVTEDVWEWEEVDSDTPATKTTAGLPKSKTAASPSSPAKRSSTPKKAPGEQKSLLSFWGKR
ncbi:DNA polymerase subunit Cdc27 [Absidia repens]|uniref:DNA polymerase delta subunit 3 n=1 Tax=Absidia repens TaxID=90262 RepID=A0A1X2IW26_9FUNG|nr:DNA polymerase subunit Cdc27 [Absidia repens]